MEFAQVVYYLYKTSLSRIHFKLENLLQNVQKFINNE